MSEGQPAALAMAWAAPTPSATPMAPPMVASVVASIRNWPRMSRGRAPTARRRPISRVRSVTETSMMFMMPMPPTSSDTAATAASSSDRVLALAEAVLAISVRLRIEKSSSWSGKSAMALAEQRVHALDVRGDVVLALELHEDRPDRAVLGVVAADDAAPAGIERHEDGVVLVLPEGRLALRRP